MLSNLLTSADGKTVVLHLVNYSDYPVENVTVHFIGEVHARDPADTGGPEKNAGNLPDRGRRGRGPRQGRGLRHHQTGAIA